MKGPVMEPEREPPKPIPGQTTLSKSEPGRDFEPSPDLRCWYCREQATSRESIRVPRRGRAIVTMQFLYACDEHRQKVKEVAWGNIPLGGKYGEHRREHGLSWDPRASGRPASRR
jgi:hypothetical protein